MNNFFDLMKSLFIIAFLFIIITLAMQGIDNMYYNIKNTIKKEIQDELNYSANCYNY